MSFNHMHTYTCNNVTPLMCTYNLNINIIFTIGLQGRGSIPSRVIPKTQKMVLDASLLNTQHYKVWIKSKWNNPGKRVVPSPTPWCTSYRKGSLQVTLDNSRPNYLTYLYLYMYLPTSLHRQDVSQVQFLSGV